MKADFQGSEAQNHGTPPETSQVCQSLVSRKAQETKKYMFTSMSPGGVIQNYVCSRLSDLLATVSFI